MTSKGRYDRRYDLQACGGYRDLCVCAEVRQESEGKGGDDKWRKEGRGREWKGGRDEGRGVGEWE